jgi:hypothetical protein
MTVIDVSRQFSSLFWKFVRDIKLCIVSVKIVFAFSISFAIAFQSFIAVEILLILVLVANRIALHNILCGRNCSTVRGKKIKTETQRTEAAPAFVD